MSSSCGKVSRHAIRSSFVSEIDKNSAVSRLLSPNRLLGLMDKAKAFALLKTVSPGGSARCRLHGLSRQTSVSDCGDYEVDLLEAFRFPTEDTLIFRLTVSNKGDKPLQHSPRDCRYELATRYSPRRRRFTGLDCTSWHRLRLHRGDRNAYGRAERSFFKKRLQFRACPARSEG